MSNKNKSTKNELEQLRLPELQARYREVTGETSRSPNRKFLIRRIEEARATREERKSAPSRSRRHVKSSPSMPVASATDGSTNVPLNVEPPVDALAQSAAEETSNVAPAHENGTATNSRLDVEPPVDAPAESADETSSAALPHKDETAANSPTRVRGRFTSMTVEELQAKYLEVVGRATGSTDRRYLIWKIGEADKGRIPVGPRKTRTRDGEPLDVKILPLRLEADVVDKMDEAWRSRGIKNRMEFFRRALGHYLAHLGAEDAAALFTNASAAGA